jgi:hypothetical protein
VTTCQAQIVASWRPGQVLELITCGEPAVAEWEYGCIHEHVVRRSACETHRPRAGEVGCVQCLHAGHDCEMAFRLVTG